ncbi:class I SAM-dependent methyltransferase [Chitinophaga sp. Cy-1792]|uniref:class I SAM-dependent methyltransferase n=1 Tax=Chitinophaga sp. Cy-1792 TaxID=2608339 RepID=UPI0014222BE4|nr:class I SAM-dependent methyltransferase [Chitinophaga sp. Cy-1792]NIG56233.1 class I SAM-dependent methyltransferase [Chitinophaga sp. Cy-1792]
MSIREAYNEWASQYDTNINRTRDLEALALRESLSPFTIEHVLEIGCGTGKNTAFFVENAISVTSVDFSEEMLAKAREKFSTQGNVSFIQADITAPWTFAGDRKFDLVSFSLVLEHIKDLDNIFASAAAVLQQNGLLYIGELHPFRQYGGSKAKYETADGPQELQTYTHHISEFVQIAARHGLQVFNANEYFDEDQINPVPRILVLLLNKE